MDAQDNPDRPELDQRPDATKMAPRLDHLLLQDSRTPEERQAAEMKEAARRKGKGRSRWWEKDG